MSDLSIKLEKTSSLKYPGINPIQTLLITTTLILLFLFSLQPQLSVIKADSLQRRCCNILMLGVTSSYCLLISVATTSNNRLTAKLSVSLLLFYAD